MTAPLSYTDKYAWGLRINPTYDTLLKTINKPIKVPLPDREAKWYANSVYRAFILEQSRKFNDFQHLSLDYQNSEAQLPEHVARVRPSDSGSDAAWNEYTRRNTALEEQDAYEASFEAMESEHRAHTAGIRRQQMDAYGPIRQHWGVDLNREDLEAAGVPHEAPFPRPPAVRMPWPAAHHNYAAAGQPQARQFQSFEQLNQGQSRTIRLAHPTQDNGRTYERMRNEAFGL